MSNESLDLATLDREQLARMVSKLEAQLTAFKQALCQRGENPDELTPRKAFEFVQMCYTLLEVGESKRATCNAQLAAARAELEQERATSERVLMQNNDRWAQLVGKLAGENDGLRAEKSKWQRRAKLFHEAYKDKDFESFALGLQEMQLEAAGADVILPSQNKSLRAKLFEACKERNRLRAALAQVGEKVKAEAVRVLEYQLQMATENEASNAVSDGLAEAVHVVSNMNLAAIVAASAETANE